MRWDGNFYYVTFYLFYSYFFTVPGSKLPHEHHHVRQGLMARQLSWLVVVVVIIVHRSSCRYLITLWL